MNIETPPMLTGNNREDISRIRRYLYKLAEDLNRMEEITPETTEAKPDEGEKLHGVVRVFSSASGASVGSTFKVGKEIDTARFFTVIFASDTSTDIFIPIILFRKGKYARGTAQFGDASGTVTLEFTNEQVKIRQGYFEGYSIREIYATVM